MLRQSAESTALVTRTTSWCFEIFRVSELLKRILQVTRMFLLPAVVNPLENLVQPHRYDAMGGSPLTAYHSAFWVCTVLKWLLSSYSEIIFRDLPFIVASVRDVAPANSGSGGGTGACH